MSDQEWTEYNVAQEKRFKAMEERIKTLEDILKAPDEKPADLTYLDDLDGETTKEQTNSEASIPEASPEPAAAPVETVAAETAVNTEAPAADNTPAAEVAASETTENPAQ